MVVLNRFMFFLFISTPLSWQLCIVKILFILLPSMTGKIENVRGFLGMPSTVCRLLSTLYLEKGTKKEYKLCYVQISCANDLELFHTED